MTRFPQAPVHGLLLLSAFALACSSGGAHPPSTAPEQSQAEKPCAGWISGSEARQIIQNGGVLLDVRTPEEYAEGHLPGALNINVKELEARISEVPEGKQVVVYCRTGKRSHEAAEILRSHGYQVSEIGTMSQYEPDAPAGCS